MDFDEKSLIKEMEIVDADMRVGCYIPITPWMKDMNVAVVESVDEDI